MMRGKHPSIFDYAPAALAALLLASVARVDNSSADGATADARRAYAFDFIRDTTRARATRRRGAPKSPGRSPTSQSPRA